MCGKGFTTSSHLRWYSKALHKLGFAPTETDSAATATALFVPSFNDREEEVVVGKEEAPVVTCLLCLKNFTTEQAFQDHLEDL